MKTPGSELINEIVARITGTVHPLRIILFGSASRGQMDRNSDLDLLIIMRDGTHRRQTSRKIFRALRGIGVSKDVIVVTERDVAEHGNNPSLVLKPALEEGRELYVAG
ncbi:MAG: nucleotidyltransferase domain-containing protein [Pseudomonadota bacterium]